MAELLGEYEEMTRKKLSEYPKVEFVLDRLTLAKGTFNLIVGTGDSAKTMLVQHIAVCFTTGKPFLGKFEMSMTGKVLHIDQELSKDQVFKRYERIANALGHEGNLGIARAKFLGLYDGAGTTLNTIKTELITAIVKSQAGLVVIDSLSRLHTLDENSTALVPLLAMLKDVAETTDACILVIHHKGKAGDKKQSGRGSSSIYDSADCQIDMSRAQNSDVTEVWCGKGRDYAKFGRLSFTPRDDGGWFKDQHCHEKLFLDLHNEAETKAEENQITILSRLLETDLIQNRLTERTGMGKPTAIKLIKSMVDDGLIVETPKGKSLSYALANSGYKLLGYESKEAYSGRTF